jgi:hypothetical protein
MQNLDCDVIGSEELPSWFVSALPAPVSHTLPALPAYHDLMEDCRYCGWLEVAWTALVSDTQYPVNRIIAAGLMLRAAMPSSMDIALDSSRGVYPKLTAWMRSISLDTIRLIRFNLISEMSDVMNTLEEMEYGDETNSLIVPSVISRRDEIESIVVALTAYGDDVRSYRMQLQELDDLVLARYDLFREFLPQGGGGLERAITLSVDDPDAWWCDLFVESLVDSLHG